VLSLSCPFFVVFVFGSNGKVTIHREVLYQMRKRAVPSSPSSVPSILEEDAVALAIKRSKIETSTSASSSASTNDEVNGNTGTRSMGSSDVPSWLMAPLCHRAQDLPWLFGPIQYCFNQVSSPFLLVFVDG
jgi:hypothetical protein